MNGITTLVGKQRFQWSLHRFHLGFQLSPPPLLNELTSTSTIPLVVMKYSTQHVPINSFFGLTELGFLKSMSLFVLHGFSSKPDIGPFPESSNSKLSCNQSLNYGENEPTHRPNTNGPLSFYSTETLSLQNLIPNRSLYTLFNKVLLVFQYFKLIICMKLCLH